MKISVVGSGYVGTTTALCLAELGHETVTIDIDPSIVSTLNNGNLHIHEEGLQAFLDAFLGTRFHASTEYESIKDTELTYLCLPTPANEDGSIDLSTMKEGVTSLGKILQEKPGKHYVVVKSTVVPGTTEKIGDILEETSGKSLHGDLRLLYNPEFLREGSAVQDFMHPDKIVIGGAKEDRQVLKTVYEGLLSDTELVETNIRTAEMIKYVNNALLATKISFANEIGNICKQLGIDTYEVMDAVGLDQRIERKFLNAGAGFGGSCFPKDVQAIRRKAEEFGVEPKVLRAILDVNEEQPLRMLELLREKIGSLAGRKIAVLGLAFKPGTNDIRNSRSIPVIKALQKRGAEVYAHDPEAKEEMNKLFPNITYTDTPDNALKKADACLLMTAWPAYEDLKIDIPCIEGRRMGKGEGICW